MKQFSITQENAVGVLRDGEASAPESAVFHSEQELETVSSHWPASRLVDIWNGLPGVAAVRKFKDRRTAVSRIWNRIQSLEPAEIPQPVAAGEPEEAAASAEPATAAVSRKDQILALLRAPDGATLGQMMAATGWQKHSLRGFLSAVVHKKMALPVHSSKSKDGERVYRVSQ